jgi:hypothetical protein
VLALTLVASETVLDPAEKAFLIAGAYGSGIEETIYPHVAIQLGLGDRSIGVRQFGRNGVQGGDAIQIAFHPLTDGGFVLVHRKGSKIRFFRADAEQRLTHAASFEFEDNKLSTITEEEARHAYAEVVPVV